MSSVFFALSRATIFTSGAGRSVAFIFISSVLSFPCHPVSRFWFSSIRYLLPLVVHGSEEGEECDCTFGCFFLLHIFLAAFVSLLIVCWLMGPVCPADGRDSRFVSPPYCDSKIDIARAMKSIFVTLLLLACCFYKASQPQIRQALDRDLPSSSDSTEVVAISFSSRKQMTRN
eukprot:GHVU01006027.1.p1 GENE.GHVU01006027.1~~GHVU01006027.1.p1  ORF type:complete len:173 (+),score=3.74 GHVU01006027.1:268-786(+)